MDNHHKNPYAYLSYVTLREVWEEVRLPFFGWAIISGVFLSLGIFGVFDVSATKNALNSEDAPILPSWVWAVILFSAISWFMKGEEVKFTFPTTFKSWLLLTFLVGLIAVFNAASFPWWIALPFYWGIFTVGDVLEVLATKGRENYLKLTDNGNESD